MKIFVGSQKSQKFIYNIFEWKLKFFVYFFMETLCEEIYKNTSQIKRDAVCDNLRYATIHKMPKICISAYKKCP